MHNQLRLTVLTVALLSAAGVQASTLIPDAGRLLQEMPLPQQQLPQSIQLDFAVPDQGQEQIHAGGPQVQLNAVRFVGVSQIPEAELASLLADDLGQAKDMRGLRELAERISAYYREQGFLFARAFLPAQRMQGGELVIEVLEGRYGAVSAVSDDEQLARRAKPFLGSLKTGEVIEAAPLERAVLILSDQPGVKLTPVVRPGDAVGTGDLQARVQKDRRFEGGISLDNHGNRYSGQNRLTLDGRWNSPLMLGDQLSASIMSSDEELYFGSISYSLPLGYSGLRGDVGYARSSYDLGSEFADLGATGYAEITSVGLSYPLWRSNRANLSASVHYQHKDLRDEFERLDIQQDKSSDVVPVSLRFDLRDSLFGGGLTYGGLTYTHGRLSLDTPALRAADEVTARTEGSFNKLNADVARIQALTADLSLYGRVLAQWANRNLDSSEDFSIGGANAVRAFPQGEGVGDQGVLWQAELRYAMGAFTPYAFWDAGRTETNHRTWTSGRNDRNLSGGGLGLRFGQGDLSLDAAAAWRHQGGEAESDSRHQNPQFWLKLAYQL